MKTGCELWDDQEHRCDFATMTERLRAMCEHMTADEQPGELLEVEPPIPEFSGDIASKQCIKDGWWNLMGDCVFETGMAQYLVSFWSELGFEARLQCMFEDEEANETFFRLWFRHAAVRG